MQSLPPPYPTPQAPAVVHPVGPPVFPGIYPGGIVLGQYFTPRPAAGGGPSGGLALVSAATPPAPSPRLPLAMPPVVGPEVGMHELPPVRGRPNGPVGGMMGGGPVGDCDHPGGVGPGSHAVPEPASVWMVAGGAVLWAGLEAGRRMAAGKKNRAGG